MDNSSDDGALSAGLGRPEPMDEVRDETDVEAASSGARVRDDEAADAPGYPAEAGGLELDDDDPSPAVHPLISGR
jgi:hypothetical protein